MPEQIEGIEDHIVATAAHQLSELGPAISADANQFAVQNGVFDRQRSESCAERSKAFVLNMLPANQAAAPVFDISNGTEPVMLQLEEPVLMVKRSRDSRRIDRGDAGQHCFNYRGCRMAR